MALIEGEDAIRYQKHLAEFDGDEKRVSHCARLLLRYQGVDVVCPADVEQKEVTQ